MLTPATKTGDDLRFYGIYRGVVIDNVDPLNAGRVRIRIYPMFSEVEDEHLPWATYADPDMGSGSMIPELETVLWTFFENGDHRFPVYFAGAAAMKEQIPTIPRETYNTDELAQAINAKRKQSVSVAGGGSWSEPEYTAAEKYPKNKVFKSKSGIVIEIDDTEEDVRLHYYHPSGSRTEILNDGTVVRKTSKDEFQVVIGDNNIFVQGDHNITSEGKCTLNAREIIVKSSDKVEVKSSSKVSIDGGSTVEIKGGRVNLN